MTGVLNAALKLKRQNEPPQANKRTSRIVSILHMKYFLG